MYQVYPRSFKDSNGDGIGDLRGIIEKLDYIASLGVGVVRVNPIFRSPNVDNGYDISDYEQIMEEFGSLADFDELPPGLHARGLKLIIDLVVNHTSDRHPWFLELRRVLRGESPRRDYYIWKRGRDGGRTMRGRRASRGRPGRLIRKAGSTTCTSSLPSSPISTGRAPRCVARCTP